jgi:tRNA modification GTPase
MTASDTIYALSSGAGRAALAVIRISGRQTSFLLTSLAGSLPPPRRLALRTITDPATGDVLDRAMIAWLPGPASFTGEDCAELHLHGSPAILSAVMQCISAIPGVRPAEAGEFTRRAFLYGKMDLVEVEGLGDLLQARTASQRRQAMRQMSGQASNIFESWREQLLLIRADIEAAVDFADEPGVAEAAAPGIDRRMHALLGDIQAEIARSRSSEVLRDGIRVVLAGHPNTGKSSLLNALARREAAIVSELPGTTRDAIEVSLDLDGMEVIVTDTAGLRAAAADVVEQEGIRRSRQHIAGADVAVWVWSPDIEGSERPDVSVEPDLIIANKSDLRSGLPRNESGLQVSTWTQQGLQELVAALTQLIKNRYGNAESALFVSARQKLAAERSIRSLNDGLALGPSQLELKAEHMRLAAEEIARLTGRIDVEEWLGAIFSRFCIGK